MGRAPSSDTLKLLSIELRARRFTELAKFSRAKASKMWKMAAYEAQQGGAEGEQAITDFLNEFEHSYLGALKIKYDYRHISQVEDWKNGNIRAKVDSSDIMNLSLSKKINMADWSINIFNLTDEVYQRPDTYNQERRRISLGFRKSY